MTTIKIKKGAGTPSGLTFGELAYDVTNKRLFIGITGGNALLANTDGGVASFNGLTGAVTGVSSIRGITGTVGITNSTGIGLSVSGQTMTFSNTGVLSINGSTGNFYNIVISGTTLAFSITPTIAFGTNAQYTNQSIIFTEQYDYNSTTLQSSPGGYSNTIYLPNTTTGTIALTNGTVASFNGLTGAVLADAVPWSVITADQTAVINKGYFANKGTLLTITLPTTAAVGSVIRVSGMTAGLWKIAQNASEVIHFGKTDTTVGVGGSISSTLARDAVELICCVADTEWNVLSSVGNITIV